MIGFQMKTEMSAKLPDLASFFALDELSADFALAHGK